MLGQTHGLRGLDINHKQDNVQLMPAVYVEFQISIFPNRKKHKVPPKKRSLQKAKKIKSSTRYTYFAITAETIQ
jgi:hypothetical protein